LRRWNCSSMSCRSGLGVLGMATAGRPTAAGTRPFGRTRQRQRSRPVSARRTQGHFRLST
jgi:hypothetical protein